MNPAKISQISEWPISRSITEVWGFLRLVRYLATFISYLVEYTIVLDGLVWKKLDKAFLKWLERHQKVFKAIKKIITGAKYLTTIDYNSGEKIYIIIYISLIETGAILSIEHIWKKACLVAFDSSKYILAQKSYLIYE